MKVLKPYEVELIAGGVEDPSLKLLPPDDPVAETDWNPWRFDW